MKPALPSESSHLAPVIRFCTLISAHAQMYNILALYMAGEVICDMEAIALQRDDVVLQPEHFTPLVWLCHVCLRALMCTSFSCSHGNCTHMKPHASICIKSYYVSLSQLPLLEITGEKGGRDVGVFFISSLARGGCYWPQWRSRLPCMHEHYPTKR